MCNTNFIKCSELKQELENFISKHGDKNVHVSYFDDREQQISCFLKIDKSWTESFNIIASEEDVYEEE